MLATAGLALALPVASAGAADQIAYECDGDICVISPDGMAAPSNLTQTPDEIEGLPAWSPDGGRIAFNADYPGRSDIFTMPPIPLAEATNVTQTPSNSELFPVWSPLGTQLAFGALDSNAANGDVYVSPASGTSAPVPIGPTSSEEAHPTWSPDGTRIAYHRSGFGGTIFVAEIDGSPPPAVLPNGSGINPAWSPDGTRIAFIHNSTGTPVVRVVTVDSGGFIDLTAPSDSAGVPAWSPDSANLAWAMPSNRIHIAPADGSSAGYDLPATTGVPGRPSWSPDGTRIAFHAGNANGIQIFVGPADGSAVPIALTNSESNLWASWKPGPPGPPGPPLPPDPPPTRPAATVKLSALGRHGPVNPYGLKVSITCRVNGDLSTHPACRGNGVATYLRPRSPRNSLASRAARKVVFARGSAAIPAGKTRVIRFALTKAGRKLLRPGRVFRITFRVKVTNANSTPVTQSKTVKVRVPRRR